jgi:hypothetical protein
MKFVEISPEDEFDDAFKKLNNAMNALTLAKSKVDKLKEEVTYFI